MVINLSLPIFASGNYAVSISGKRKSASRYASGQLGEFRGQGEHLLGLNFQTVSRDGDFG
jgi:hypothetical protein